jgi:hypothetical protein
MSTERIVYCDGPDCECHARTAAKGRQPTGFLCVTGDGEPRHFHNWECAMRYAAQFEPPEIIHPQGEA